MIEHIMVLKKKLELGGELWECPDCHKQIIIQRGATSSALLDFHDNIIHTRQALGSRESYIELVDDFDEMMRDWNESI